MDKPDVVILCGGRGSRLGSLTKATPKPLLDVGGSPFLLRLLRRFQQEGFSRFILAAHYLADQFQNFVQDHSKLFPNVEVVVEKEPLGTGGALKNAARYVRSENFVALNGDVFVTQPLTPVLKRHFEKKNVFTMVAVKTENVEGVVRNKGGLELGAEEEVLSFRGHSQINENWVNAGVYVVDKEKILSWPEGCYDLEKELASLLYPDQARAFRSEAKLLDIGTPECLKLAKERYETYSLSSC